MVGERTGSLLIRGARQLLTLRGPKGPRRGSDLNELGILPDGAVLIRDGLLVEVGPSRRVENLAAARDADVIDASGRVVMPGFIDSHTHLVYPPPGSAPPGSSAAGEAALQAIRTMSCRLLQARLRPFLDSMVRHGTTTVEVKTGCGPDESAEAKALRALALPRNGPVEVLPTFLLRLPASASGAEALQTAVDLPPRIFRRRLARFADVYWESAASQDCYAAYLEQAAGLGIPVKVHAEGPGSAAAIALAIGHRAASIDHLEHISLEQTEMLAVPRTVATLLPAAALRRGGPIAPARALIEAGAAVALASNFNPHETPVANMQTVVALACLQMAMSPAEAISAATINAAHALGIADRTGSLEPGKVADLVLLNLDDYREAGHRLGSNLVHATVKSGRCVYREGTVAASYEA